MGVLDVFSVLLGIGSGNHILFTITFPDKLLALAVSLLRYTGRIRSQIRNQADRTMTFHRYSFIKLLCDAHCFLGGKIHFFRALLLKRTRCKGKRRFLRPLTPFYIRNFIAGALQRFYNLIHFFSRNIFLLLWISIVFCHKRLFTSFYSKGGLQRPVLIRYKGINFRLPVGDNAQGNGLHPPGAQSPFHLLPQNRANRIPNHAVKNTPRLLGVHKIHIDPP